MTKISKPERRAKTSQAAADRKQQISARSSVRRTAAADNEHRSSVISKDRKQLKGIAIYMNPAAKRLLDKIALDHERTVQDLGIEALNLLFRHYGEKPIA